MIVVLCDSYYQAGEAYRAFLFYLYQDSNRKEEVSKTYPHCYCVETDVDFRYIFIDRRMKNSFSEKDCDFIDVEEFFEAVEDYYDEYGFVFFE